MRYRIIAGGLAFAAAAGALTFALHEDQPQLAAEGPRLIASAAAEWPTSAPPREARFSNDGRELATTDASGLVTVRDTSTWRPIARFNHDGGATSVGFSPDGSKLYTAGYDGAVRIWDVRRKALVNRLPISPEALWTLDVSPDGSHIAAAGEDGTIRVLDSRDPKQRLSLRGHEKNVWQVRFSPDGNQLASGSFDRSARLWDTATGEQLKELDGHKQAVVGLAFSPDGRSLATCGDDSTIRIWRVTDGAQTRKIEAGNHVYKVEFSRDGKWLASGRRAFGAIGTLWHQLTGLGGLRTPAHIWRVSDWSAVAALPAADDTPHVSFSGDNHWLVTTGEDNRIRLWRLRATKD